MAKDSPISYLPGTDPETVQANLEYQNALANLKDALDARKNRLFDPALASFAAAMLEPGHGGGFGEALGRSVRAYSAGEEEDIKQQQELAAKNVDIARMGLELQRQRGSDALAKNIISRRFNTGAPAPAAQGPAEPPKPTSPLAAAAGPAAPSAAPTPPLSAPGVAGAQPSSRTFKLGTPSGMSLSPDEVMALYLTQHPGDTYGAIEAASKVGERVKVQQGYVYNPDTAEYTIPPGQPAVKFYFNNGTYEIDPADAIHLDSLRTSKDPSFAAEAKRVIADRPSLEEIEAAKASRLGPVRSREAGATTAAQKEAEQEAADRLAIRDAGREAGTTIAFTKTIRTLANDKQANQIFGILTTPNLLDNVANILDKGVMGIRIAGLEDALRNTGLDEAGIAKARLAAQQFNQLQIRLASAAKGAVSDYERQLFADAAINMRDPVQAIHMKNDMLEAKAVFDRNISKAFRQSKMGVEDFRDSDAYQREYQTYIERIQGIAGGQRLTETPPAAKPAAPSGEKLSVDELRKRLDKMRGQ